MSIPIVNVVYAGRLPKTQESLQDCQDAVAVGRGGEAVAISDGVSKSFLPGYWSDLLVEKFTGDLVATQEVLASRNWRAWLEPIQPQWRAKAEELISPLRDAATAHLRNQLATKAPAAATFAGIQFTKAHETIAWNGMLIGDSCLFQINSTRINSWLLRTSTEFSQFTPGFPSYGTPEESEPVFINGTLKSGEIMLLATDALSKWLLVLAETDPDCCHRTINDLFLIRKDCEFEQFIAQARNRSVLALEDDDVALITLCGEKEPASAPVAIPDMAISQSGNPTMEPTGGFPLSFSSPIHPGALISASLSKDPIIILRPRRRRRSFKYFFRLMVIFMALLGLSATLVILWGVLQVLATQKP